MARGLRGLAGLAIAVLPLLLGGSCDQSPVTPAASLSLAETFHHLRDLHRARSYAPLREYLDGAAGRDTIEMLMAVDELLANDAGALHSIRLACPDINLRAYDHSGLADELELFSRRVELVNTSEQGDHGVMTVQLFDCRGSEPVPRVPLKRLSFERRQGRWVYLPGPEDPGIASLTREMARSLRDISRVASTRSLTSEQVAREYYLRLDPLLKQIREVGGRLPPETAVRAVPSSEPAAS